jgi:S-formylglutathione hydrolase FrmB
VQTLNHLSLLHGWLPALVAAGAWSALVLGVAWWRRAPWHWVAIAAAAGLFAALVGWMLDIPARVGSTYPRSFTAWAALPVFALGATVWQWTRVRWWRRLVSALAVPLLAAFGALQVNAHYGYLPTVGDALGAKLPGEVSAPGVDALPVRPAVVRDDDRARDRTGTVLHLAIPAVVSAFRPREAYVWLPAVWFSSPRPQLPVLMLLSGTPGTPRDWFAGGHALSIANAWSVTHDGVAPVMVAPDINGSATGDTECVGRAETYLTVDVRAFMRERFGVALAAREWAIAGMSEGGTCALELTARHPELFGTFADFAGDERPTVGSARRTLRVLFGGSRAALLAHDPANWFRTDAADGVAGFVAVGSDDHGYEWQERSVVALARADHLAVTLYIVPGGGHNWPTVARAFRDVYPWLVARVSTGERRHSRGPPSRMRVNA